MLRRKARGQRQQAEVDRESAEADRAMAALPPDHRGPIERARTNRARAVRAINELARNEDEAALVYEELAEQNTSRHDEYLASASRWHEAAQAAREAVRALDE